MLSGFSPAWVDADQRRQVSYTNLRPGHYQFRVGVTGDEIWNGAEAVWHFTIEPPFYQTYWFYAACAGGIGLAFWTLWWLRLRAVRNEFGLIVAERARVSRDIHDTLLQSLGAFSLQLEIVARQLEPSQSAARERLRAVRTQVGQCISEARRSIWELRSPRFEANDLADALKELAEDSTIAAAAARVEVAVTGKPRRSSSRTEEQLLKIAQEAIANAVRHSHADTIAVTLDYSWRSLRLQVSDNGHGFDQHTTVTPEDEHWGLKTMSERAATLKGRLKISSEPGRGTTVEAIVPF
jgi:signal transduction histidine kinase